MTRPTTKWAQEWRGTSPRELVVDIWDSQEARQLVAIVFVSLALRLYRLGAEPLWTDELTTLHYVDRFAFLELFTGIPQAQPHLPLYYALLELWMQVAGETTVALRILSVIFSIGCLVGLYLIGHTLYGHATGAVAALIFGLSQFQIYYAQEVRMYSMFAFFAVSSYLLLLRLRADQTRLRAGAYLLVTTLLVYTHPFGVFVVGAQWIYFLFDSLVRPNRGRRRAYLQAVAGMAVILSPGAVAVMLRATNSVGGGFEFVPAPTFELVFDVVVGYFATTSTSITPYRLYVALLVGALATSAVVGWKLSAGRRHGSVPGLRFRTADVDQIALLVTWIGVPLAGLLAVSYLVTPLFWPRYTIPASLGLYLLVARGVTVLDRRSLRVVLLLFLFTALVPSTAFYHAEDTRQQWDDATDDIDAIADDDAVVIVSKRISRHGITYYSDRDDLQTVGTNVERYRVVDGEIRDPEFEDLYDTHDEVWLVLSLTTEREERILKESIDRCRERTWHRNYEGIELVRYGGTCQ